MKNMTFLASIFAFFAMTSCGQDEVALRLAHYNVGAFKKTAESSVGVIADMMREIGADVVSVNEVDSCAVRTGQVDQLAELAEKMGDWGCHYTAAMPFQGGAYGVGITYDPKLDLVKKNRVGLPKLSGTEPRVLAVTEFEDFVFATCHLDYKNEETQLGQIAVINEYVDSVYGGADKPFFLCGDFNCEPGSTPISEMQKTWTLISATDLTYPAVNSRKCIDFIFVRPGNAEVKVVGSKVYTDFTTGNVETASDHLPVIADVVIIKK